MGVVAIFDGFGDADLDNNGVPLEDYDVSVQGSVESTTYIPGRLYVDGMSGERTNTEVASVLDAADTGIRWLQIRGWSDALDTAHPGPGSPKPQITIVDDTQGAMVETSGGAGGLGIDAIDSGYAMAWESRGGGSVAAGFFDRTISLGSTVGDTVKVSFDFRVWRDAPNTNSGADSNNSPSFGELRFGLYQDTDNQLGMTNPFAGRQVDEEGNPLPNQSADFMPAVWGQEQGLFEGALTGTQGAGDEIGANGDAGWQASVHMGDALVPDGGGSRIREEVNADRLLQGSTDVETVARPENMASGGPFDPPEYDFINLDLTKVYNIELVLTRATLTEEADTIHAELRVTDKQSGAVKSFGDTNDLDDINLPGLDSDSWDYFAIRNASSGGGEFDFIMDNFTIEVEGSSAVLLGDFNGDLVVDAADYTVWRDNLNAADESLIGNAGDGSGVVDAGDYDLWRSQFGEGVGPGASASSVAPEPSGVWLAVAAAATLGRRRRSCWKPRT
ncbi:hypothetical protein KOR34_02790 [Posidoniimonas corsicana]|uniref:PEP-CTERM protein-sorting domain-containing protein n=1 Tax=Posidoniimonas corsicana TaxID=1938618 RepID=A0A5C5VA00_9BACT|nr:hypothetical protein [Posidoniimonas corsicana]TWT35388.1 hypothetical protein KOR34_02790 [Posidoniimonas corsicana]